MTKLFSACVTAVLLSACVQTNEVALAPNAVRLDTQASGLLFAGMAGDQTQSKAAEATLQRGYTRFRLEQVEMASGRDLIGVQHYENGSINVTSPEPELDRCVDAHLSAYFQRWRDRPHVSRWGSRLGKHLRCP